MLNFAVVGIGRMGSVHAKNLIKGRVKGARLCAVCDVSEEVLSEFKTKNPKIPGYTDYKDLAKLEKLDAVVVAVPHYSHAEIAGYYLERGVNTLVEKPITVSVAEAKKLLEVSEKHPEAMFAIMYNQRTNRMYKKAKQLIDSGEIGEIQRLNFIITNWYRSEAYYKQGGWRASWAGEGGGTLINQCVHQLDIMQWLVGMPKSVRSMCKTVNRNITTENEVLAVFEFDGFDGVFQSSAHELFGTNRLEIAGTKGKICIRQYKMKYKIFKQSEQQVNSTTTKGYGGTKCVRHRLTYGLRLIRDTLYGQQQNILNNFGEAIAKGDKGLLISPASDGILALSLINGVYLSAWTDKKVSLPLDGEKYYGILAEKIKNEKSLKQKD